MRGTVRQPYKQLIDDDEQGSAASTEPLLSGYHRPVDWELSEHRQRFVPSLVDLPADALLEIAGKLNERRYQSGRPGGLTTIALRMTCKPLHALFGAVTDDGLMLHLVEWLMLRKDYRNAKLGSLRRCVVAQIRVMGTDWIEPTRLGDMVGDVQVGDAVLAIVLDTIPVVGLTLDVAMRKLVAQIRLPGEAGRLDRILYRFAQHYHTANPSTYAAEETVHVLCFALRMLSVDLHCSAIAPWRKTSEETFLNNLRGIEPNGGTPPEAQLCQLYRSLRRYPLDVPTARSCLRPFWEGWLELISKPDSLVGWRRAARRRRGRQRHVYNFCVLSAHSLLLYSSADDEEPHVMIPLYGLRCCPKDGHDGRAFSLEVPDCQCARTRASRHERHPVLQAVGLLRKQKACRCSKAARLFECQQTDGNEMSTVEESAFDLASTTFEAESLATCRDWIEAIKDRTYWY